MNLFDSLQDRVQNIVAQTMGYPASWQPLDGSPLQTATVLLNQPTDKYRLEEDFEIVRPRMEYKAGDFTGLFERVQKNNFEIIVINNISYYTTKAEKKYDGKTIIIYLEFK